LASVEYDPSCNAFYIRLKKGKVARSEPVSDDVIIDFGADKRIVGIEVLVSRPIDVEKFPIPVKTVKSKRSNLQSYSNPMP